MISSLLYISLTKYTSHTIDLPSLSLCQLVFFVVCFIIGTCPYPASKPNFCDIAYPQVAIIWRALFLSRMTLLWLEKIIWLSFSIPIFPYLLVVKIGSSFGFVRGKQVIVGANSRFGRSGQRTAQKDRSQSWWKKTLGQRCNSSSPKHSAWCPSRSPWQSMTRNIRRTDNQ